ncbi:MAG: 5-formyltetrahydrofolate cyclo-ligase [Gammaproteobacteria bacterium]
MNLRPELRKQMRRQRRSLSPVERFEYAERAARLFARTRLFRSSRHIACYWPCDGELDPLPLMQHAWARNKTCYLPVLNELPSRRLWFAPYREGDPLVYNRFGILEPSLPVNELASAWMLDLILAPVVAFDAQGNRLGMGGGFYDRTLAFLNRRQHWHSPRLFGMAYDFQRVAYIKPAVWDVPLQGVVTEAGLYLSP